MNTGDADEWPNVSVFLGHLVDEGMRPKLAATVLFVNSFHLHLNGWTSGLCLAAKVVWVLRLWTGLRRFKNTLTVLLTLQCLLAL